MYVHGHCIHFLGFVAYLIIYYFQAKYLFCPPMENSVQSVSVLAEGAAPATACIESLWDTSCIIELKVFFYES